MVPPNTNDLATIEIVLNWGGAPTQDYKSPIDEPPWAPREFVCPFRFVVGPESTRLGKLSPKGGKVVAVVMANSLNFRTLCVHPGSKKVLITLVPSVCNRN